MEDFMTIANSPVMWVCCSVAVLVALLQSVLYFRSSIKAGREIGMSDKQMNAAIRSTAIAGVGPGLANMVGVVTLATAIGAPIAWMRLSVIGAVSYEMKLANIGAEAMGVEFGGAGFGTQAFAASVWAMCLGTTIYVLFPMLFANKFDKLSDSVVKGNKAKLGVFAAGCSMGSFAYLTSSYPIKGVQTGNWANLVAALGGGVVYVLMNKLKAKTGKKWIGEWALSFAIFGGLLCAVAFNAAFGA